MAITPNRVIKLEVDGPEQSTVTRPHFRRGWKAGQIGRADGWVARVDPITGAQVRVAGNVNTNYLPSDIWTLTPLGQQKLYGLVSNSGIPASAILQPGDFVIPVNVRWSQIFRPPPPEAGGGGFTTVAPAMKRRVPRGIPWDHSGNFLGADQAAYPPPFDPDYPDAVPMDRVAYSNAEFEANQGFGITFGYRSEFWGNPGFMRLYFGGPTPLQPGSHVGGAFCLVLRGSGMAILYERNAVAAWERRMVFQWAPSDNITDFLQHIYILPLARDRILFGHRTTDIPAHTGAAGLVVGIAAATLTVPSNPTMSLYRDTPGQTGHQHLGAMTGVGKFRIDLRRDFRLPYVPWLIKYPASGVVRDEPFVIPHGVEANTPIQLITDGFILNGSTMTGVIRDADNGLILPVDGFGRFLTLAGKQQYYGEFTLFSSANQNQTPVLFGYTVNMGANSLVRTNPPTTCRVRDGSVTGPDIAPGHGAAEVKLRRHPNVGARLTGGSSDPEPMDILRLHDRRYARLRVDVPTTGPSGDPRGYVILHAGETWQPRAQLRGRAGMDNVGWWDFSVPMVDLWVRVAKQLTWQHLDYSQDPIDTASPKRPPVIMAVIRDLLMQAGFPADELDTPGWDDPTNVRLFHTPSLDKDQWQVIPGSDIALLIKRLAFDMLGKVVIHDPNAYQGANLLRGVWRVINPPQPSVEGTWQEPAIYALENSLAEFHVRRPASLPPHTVIEDEAAMGVSITFVKDGSYFNYPEAPEKTSLTVTGHGGLLPKGGAGANMYAHLVNPKAVSWDPGTPTADPTSIDYMDRVEPLFVNDPSFQTPEALNWMAVRIARQALRGRLWCEWVAPLLFITDPGDPLLTGRRRPLRVYDQVTLWDEHGVGHPVMLRSVNAFWRGASQMWMWCQGLLLDAR